MIPSTPSLSGKIPPPDTEQLYSDSSIPLPEDKSFKSILDQRRKIQREGSQNENRSNGRPILEGLRENMYTACFIPEDPGLLDEEKYFITLRNISKLIQTRVQTSYSHIYDISTIAKAQKAVKSFDPTQIEQIRKDLVQKGFTIRRRDQEKETENLKELLQTALNIPIKTNSNHSKYSVDLKRLPSRMNSISILAKLIFCHFSKDTQAEIKVKTDLISIFNRLPEGLYDKPIFEVPSPYNEISETKGFYTPLFDELSEEILEWIDSLPPSIKIEHLDLSKTYLQTIPIPIRKRLTELKTLDFQDNEAESLTLLCSIAELPLIEELNLSNNRFKKLPPLFLHSLRNLRILNLSNNLLSKETKQEIIDTCQFLNIHLILEDFEPQTT